MGGTVWCRTGRSTTTGLSVGNSSRQGTGSRPTATPKFSYTCTRRGGLDSGACAARHVRDRDWDPGRHRLVLARDRFGIKPLYYRLADDQFSFGRSELKALLRQPGFERRIDLDAVESFLAFNSIPSPMTIFEDVRKLPAGHLLVGP